MLDGMEKTHRYMKGCIVMNANDINIRTEGGEKILQHSKCGKLEELP